MSKVTIMIGLPMSGKSHWVKNNVQDEIILNADSIRIMITGENDKLLAFKQKNEKLVWDIFGVSLSIALNTGRDIIIDNTNCNLKLLKKLVERIKSSNYEIEFKLIDTDLWLIKKWLEMYPHMEHIVDKMNEGLQEVKEYINSEVLK
jgi:predicted kinase